MQCILISQKVLNLYLYDRNKPNKDLHYLKRFITVLILFVLISIIVSLFLSSELIVKKSTVVKADKRTVQSLILDHRYDHLLTYKIEPAEQKWELIDKDEDIELISEVKIDLGFNPLNKFHGLFDQEKISNEMQHELDSLKAVLENLPKIHRVQVKKILNENDSWFLSIRDTVNQYEINNIHGKLYEKINRFMDDEEIESIEPPIVIYHFWSDTLIDIEAGIPVKDTSIIGKGSIKMNKIKKGYVVTATHYGSYERLPETYFGINEWMRKNKVVVTGVPWEVYITDPTNETDPEKWETAIFFPVK